MKMEPIINTTPPKRSKKLKQDYSLVLEIVLYHMPKEILTHHYFIGVRRLLPFIKIGFKIPTQQEDATCWDKTCPYNDLTNRGWCCSECFRRLIRQIAQTEKLPSDTFFYGHKNFVSCLDMKRFNRNKTWKSFFFLNVLGNHTIVFIFIQFLRMRWKAKRQNYNVNSSVKKFDHLVPFFGNFNVDIANFVYSSNVFLYAIIK